MSRLAFMLDASAVLALLYDEPGGERVAAVLSQAAFINAVNWCEVLTKIEDRGWPADAEFQVRFRRVRAALDVVPFDEAAAWTAASLRRPTRQANLSLADRSCLATARLQDVQVLTADRPWAELDVGVVVELIR